MNPPSINGFSYDSFLGEGATGQVHVAHNDEGKVALKLLKRLAVNPKLIGYGLARLRSVPQHPNLVEIKDFSMEGRPLFIATSLHTYEVNGEPRGYSLESQCGGLDPELSWEIIEQIAAGMGHLHMHGVVHCSLNPRNVMVADPDTPEVRITDFGQGWLADISHIEFSESFLYAPPEQLMARQAMYEGQAFRWDVYAFGVTAYRLLYQSFPRGQEWIDSLHQNRVEFHPQAISEEMQRQPAVPWPATRDEFDEQRQRILEKCLSLNPLDRFLDMREVLQEFKRIEQDERRSLQNREAALRIDELTLEADAARRRTNVFRFATIVLIGLGILSILFNITSESRLLQSRLDLQETRKKAAADLQEAAEIRDDALRQKERFQRGLTYSQRTSDAFLQFLLKARQPDSPEYQSVDGYLASARAHYERVLDETKGEEALYLERLRAQLGLALIDSSQGDAAATIAAFDDVLRQIESLPEIKRSEVGVRQIHGRALSESGRLKMLAGRREEALQATQESVLIHRQLLEEDPKDPELRRRCGRVYFQYGRLLAESGDLGGALKSQQNAMVLLEELTQSSDAREEDAFYLARCQFEVGMIRNWENQGIEAFEAFQLASQGFSKLIDRKPQIPQYRFQLARCFYFLGRLSFQEKGDEAEAETARKTTSKLLGMLLDRDEGNRDYQFALALVLADLAEMDRDAGRSAEAMENIDRSMAILKVLHEELPANPDYQYHLALKSALRGDLLLDAAKQEEALAAMRQAMELINGLGERSVGPSIPSHVREFEVATFYGNLAHALEAAGRSEEAAAYRAKASQLWSGLAEQRPDDRRIRDAAEAFQSRSPS